MSVEVGLWGPMSRVESPFHAIAAQALDHTAEVEANNAAATTTSSDVGAQEHGSDSLKTVPDSHMENGGNEVDENRVSGEEGEEEGGVPQDRRASLGLSSEGGQDLGDPVTKKSKKRTNVWTKTTSRKSTKKGNGKNSSVRVSDAKDDNVLLKPFHQEDDSTYPILLSKVYKAEKIELSADRLAASGSKGYRMVRATRGVVEGAWYFEIYVEKLGDTGHTRLGWSTRRGDIQAPVGYDAHSYAYRDVNGSKVHAASPEEYGEAYYEKDVIGFYINLPREEGFVPIEEEVYGYKGQPYTIVADNPLKPVPGSEILFFKNGVCQGVAFRDINDGIYFPAASLYTHPSQDFCKVVFNFGPDFKYPVTDLGDLPFPSPMCEASGPGARAEVAPTTETEVVAGSADKCGGNQQVALDVPTVPEVEKAIVVMKEESIPKRVGKAPLPKKKEKVPKTPEENRPTMQKKPKPGEFALNPEFKREVNAKGTKKDVIRAGPVSTTLVSKKGGMKETTRTGLPILKGSKKAVNVTVVPTPKGSKKDVSGRASVNLEVSKKSVAVTGLSSQGKKRSIPGTEPSNVKSSKKDVNGTGGMSLEGSRREMTAADLPNPKRMKKDTSATGLQSSKKSKKSVPQMGFASSFLMSHRGWEGKIQGAVDVVVVESSTPHRVGMKTL